ncbi:MAG: hypothetical protein PSX71_10850 [bacterium]|nr:hypothetical protein [bacterium]
MDDTGSTETMPLMTLSAPDTASAITAAAVAAAPAVPLAAGIDGVTFDHHYRQVRSEKKQQWLQRLFTGWHFYGEPLGLGLFPGKLYADLFLSPDVGLATITFLSCSSAILIVPWWMRHRRLNNQHKRSFVFYTTALERCITQKAAPSAQ